MTPDEKRRQTYERKRLYKEKARADRERTRLILEQSRDSSDASYSERLKAIELLQSMA